MPPKGIATPGPARRERKKRSRIQRNAQTPQRAAAISATMEMSEALLRVSESFNLGLRYFDSTFQSMPGLLKPLKPRRARAKSVRPPAPQKTALPPSRLRQPSSSAMALDAALLSLQSGVNAMIKSATEVARRSGEHSYPKVSFAGNARAFSQPPVRQPRESIATPKPDQSKKRKRTLKDSKGSNLVPKPKATVKEKAAKPLISPFFAPDPPEEPSITIDLDSTPGRVLRSARKTTTVSPYFYTDPFSIVPTPPHLHFELQPSHFGLIQERICNNLFALVIQTILWNQTTGKAARPVLFKLLSTYPTPEKLAEANQDDVLDIISSLGLQNSRSKRLIDLAKVWVTAPPDASRRYGRRDYPKPGDNRDTKNGEALAEDDPRVGWEIGHLPGVGPYALDSYRIFYRDTLRGIKPDDGTEPEWQRVVPLDKDLRAYLVWRWKEEGFDYDVKTGQRTRLSPDE